MVFIKRAFVVRACTQRSGPVGEPQGWDHDSHRTGIKDRVEMYDGLYFLSLQLFVFIKCFLCDLITVCLSPFLWIKEQEIIRNKFNKKKSTYISFILLSLGQSGGVVYVKCRHTKKILKEIPNINVYFYCKSINKCRLKSCVKRFGSHLAPPLTGRVADKGDRVQAAGRVGAVEDRQGWRWSCVTRLLTNAVSWPGTHNCSGDYKHSGQTSVHAFVITRLCGFDGVQKAMVLFAIFQRVCVCVCSRCYSHWVSNLNLNFLTHSQCPNPPNCELMEVSQEQPEPRLTGK